MAIYDEKLKYSIELMRKTERLALQLDPENGFYLAFSGGKDSQTLYHVAKMAGVKFKAHMSLTSCDPPEVIRFVRRCYPDVELIKPKISIYNLAKKKGIAPTKTIRYCCAEYKEIHGAGKVTLLGIRKQESVRRSKRQEFEIKHHKWSSSFDQWEKHNEQQISCVNGKDKYMVSPILEWTEKEVWAFLDGNGIEHCSLYDQGQKRIGCIMCPMASKKQRKEEIKRYPHIYHKWLDAFACMSKKDGKFSRYNLTPEEVFDWWINNKSIEKWYAENKQQLKLDL